MKKVLGYLPLFVCALGVLAMMGLFMPAAEFAGETYSGWNIAIGYSETFEVLGNETKIKVCEFSVLNLAPYILVAMGIACAVTLYKAGHATKAAWSGALCFFAASLFFFVSPDFVRLSQDVEKALMNLGIKEIEVDLAFGAILAGSVSIFAGVCMIVSNYLNPSKVALAR
ncbi:MAG: hypothetical protein IKA88_07660 [Clostridia bacterium]|nr:hypothetical protein [Clostridia bacterium]